MQLREQILQCTKCSDLVKSRNKIVVGEGPIPCKLVFLGEAPGRTEDKTGVPFTGISGTHLRMVLNLLKLTPKQFYILNLLKCHPPDNRNPSQEELDNCRPFLLQQLEALEPTVVVPLGRYAFSFVLGVPPAKIAVSKYVGRILHNSDFPETKFIGTYHPAFVLRKRNTDVEKAFRRHLKKAKRFAYALP